MPETHPPTRFTEKKEKHPHRRRDPRAADTGLAELATEERGEGAGFAEERSTPATEHKEGRTDEGSAA